MFCENCGTQILDNSVFCSECGCKVSEPSSPEQLGPIPPVMRPTTAPRQPSRPYGDGPEPRQTYNPSRQAADSTNSFNESEYNKTDYHSADIISFGQYVLMIFLAGIPIINIILLVKWGFFQKQAPNKRNFAKALLFYYLIAVIIYVAYIWLWLKVTSS